MSTGVPYFPQTLPAGTVVGRLAASAGPTEAIPFATLFGQMALGGPIASVNVQTMAALRALAVPTSLVTVLMLGFAAAGDGGWGIYWWNAGDTTADDGGTIIQPNAGGNGRWKKL